MVRSERDGRVFVCYVPGLDLRRLSPEWTPYICGLLDEFSPVRLRGLPDTELVPTLVTGVWPHEHGIWQVRLRGEEERSDGFWPRLAASLPDGLGTTLQGVAHFATKRVDLATIPPRRRQQFELLRFKYERRVGGWTEPAPGIDSVFSVVGADRGRYRLVRQFRRFAELERALPDPDLQLDFLELYALDIMQHWNLDRLDRVERGFRRVDAFVRRIHARAGELGVRFVLLSDHGQEAVRGTIDLRDRLRTLNLDEDEYAYYLQVPSVRFWFRTGRARQAVRRLLEGLDHVTVLHHREMAAHGVDLPTPEHGELYAYADPGWIFFPHDFYQPLANLVLGLSDGIQRPRIADPVHRGSHGYLTGHPSEIGLFLADDTALTPRTECGELVDVAPTLLELLGSSVPDRMSGRSLYG